MKDRFRFLVSYLIIWIAILITGKILFLIVYFKNTLSLDPSTIAGIFYHGAKLDFSFIGYVFVFPLLVMFTTTFFSGRYCYHILKVYNY